MHGTNPDSEWGSPPRHRQTPTRCSPCGRDDAQDANNHCIIVPSSSSCNKSSGSILTDDTPRKMRRIQALKNARFNQTGRCPTSLLSFILIARSRVVSYSDSRSNRGLSAEWTSTAYRRTPLIPSFNTERNKSVMTVQKSWTEQSHQFLSDRDLLGPLGTVSSASSQEDA